MKVYAVIPARSGSKGFPNKNIQELDSIPLISYSIQFAKKLGCDKVICSTDSEQYAVLAREYGAEVPFLRSEEASSDTSMEQDILKDLYSKFISHNIELPDILVWLRPTFVFRDLELIKKAISTLKSESSISAVRTVCEAESRLYSLNSQGRLVPKFDDQNKSMIRRQDVGSAFKVFSTDIFRFHKDNLHEDFLGRNVVGLQMDKICGLDIDDETDFRIVEILVKSQSDLIRKYLFT